MRKSGYCNVSRNSWVYTRLVSNPDSRRRTTNCQLIQLSILQLAKDYWGISSSESASGRSTDPYQLHACRFFYFPVSTIMVACFFPSVLDSLLTSLIIWLLAWLPGSFVDCLLGFFLVACLAVFFFDWLLRWLIDYLPDFLTACWMPSSLISCCFCLVAWLLRSILLSKHLQALWPVLWRW